MLGVKIKTSVICKLSFLLFFYNGQLIVKLGWKNTVGHFLSKVAYAPFHPSGPKGLKPCFTTSLNFIHLVPFHFVDFIKFTPFFLISFSKDVACHQWIDELTQHLQKEKKFKFFNLSKHFMEKTQIYT